MERPGFGREWFALICALVLHVTDEAVSGFLDLWNPSVHRLRAEIPWLRVPTFSFEVWIAGLSTAVVGLGLLTPFAAKGGPRLRRLAYALAGIMFLNGLGHIGASIYLGRIVPGVASSPVLLICSVWLLVRLRRLRRLRQPGSRSSNAA